jgi:hypothetical protein
MCKSERKRRKQTIISYNNSERPLIHRLRIPVAFKKFRRRGNIFQHTAKLIISTTKTSKVKQEPTIRFLLCFRHVHFAKKPLSRNTEELPTKDVQRDVSSSGRPRLFMYSITVTTNTACTRSCGVKVWCKIQDRNLACRAVLGLPGKSVEEK